MSDHALPNKEVVVRITQLATKCFHSFGGGQQSRDSILRPVFKDKPAVFALGVDISEVVTMVLTIAGYQGSQNFIECWEGHTPGCDSLDEGSPRTDCTCGYTAARSKVLEKEDNTHAMSEL